MIAYQEYNTKSPLNGLAAKWAAPKTASCCPWTRGAPIAPPAGGPAHKTEPASLPQPSPAAQKIPPAVETLPQAQPQRRAWRRRRSLGTEDRHFLNPIPKLVSWIDSDQSFFPLNIC